MHKFLKSIGFSDIRKKDLEIILEEIVKHPDAMKITKDSEGNEFTELSKEFAPGIGIRVCGTYEEDDSFDMEYFFPYMNATTLTTQEDIEIQKHAEHESFAGISDEMSLGVTLIFFLQNVADYLSEHRLHERILLHGAYLSALALDGKILIPQKKREDRTANHRKYEKRNQLIAQAREGDEDAIESLTIEDMDLYSMISRRVLQEDILSIVSSCFMPYGIESDQYAIIGEILEVTKMENRLTHEQLYQMKVLCNDLTFDICVNEKDLLGHPKPGRRFKGNIWMQGNVCL